MSDLASSFYLGGPVWAVKKWAGPLFPSATPARDYLAAYSRRLSTVEGNSSFYAMPSLDMISRWRAETPPTFRFCCKFPRAISHDRPLRIADPETAAATAAWIDRLRALGDRAGPSFLQLPPTFAPNQLPHLRDYLAALPRGPHLRYAVEVRHPAWFQPGPERALSTLLQEQNMARVLFDVRPLRAADPDTLLAATDNDPQATREAQERKPDVPVRFLRTAPFTLIRYISHPTTAANAPYLDEWADALAAWLREGTEVFFFLHYPGDDHVPDLCQDLHRRVSARVPLPPLPPFGDPAPRQISLFG